MQSTTMVGPTMTLLSTGSVYNAGITLGANKAVEKETGMTTSEIISKKFKQKHSEKENLINDSLITLIDLNFYKTRKILLNQNKISKNN